MKVSHSVIKPMIFLTQRLPGEVLEKIEKVFDLRCPPGDDSLRKDQLIEGLKQVEGLISMLSDSVDREVLDAAPHLKIISNYAVGYNNIDLEAAQERGIVVTNTPGVLTETTADLSWALMMAVARRIPEGSALVKSGKWRGWRPTEMLGYDFFGKTIGVIGMGRIGQALARRAQGFSMKILYHQRNRLPKEVEVALKLNYFPLSELLRRSDFVSLHLPLNDESRHLINAQAFRWMKKTAFLINTARGAVVDEQALVEALSSKSIAGAAGLDVFEGEPHVSPTLLGMDNVVTLPHIGSASFETRLKMGEMVLENLLAFFEKKPPPNMVSYS